MSSFEAYDKYCWQQLALAVVLEAVNDWCKTFKTLQNPRTMSAEKLEIYRSTEYFFRSGWCETLCGIDGKYLLKKLKEQDPDEVVRRLRVHWVRRDRDGRAEAED